jgi:hypothetical protein
MKVVIVAERSRVIAAIERAVQPEQCHSCCERNAVIVEAARDALSGSMLDFPAGLPKCVDFASLRRQWLE